jgi:hypothetical protein
LGELEDQFFATVFLASGLLFVACLFAAAAVMGALIESVAAGNIDSETYYFGRRVRPTEPTSEHVTQFAFSARLLQCERRVTERDACLAGRMIHLFKGEQPPTSQRQPSQIVLEHCQPTQPMRFGFMLTPKVGRIVAGPVQDFSIPLAAECSLNGGVVVDEKMAGHVEHRQTIGGPYARLLVYVDG